MGGSDYRRQGDFVGLEKACSRSETSLSRNSFEYSEVTMNQQMSHSLLANDSSMTHHSRLPPTHPNAYTLSRDDGGALLMSHDRNDETDSGCSSMPGDNSLLR